MAKQVFIAEDGTQFPTEEAVNHYEAQMPKKAAIQQWATEFYGSNRVITKNVNIIMAWESYRDSVLPAV